MDAQRVVIVGGGVLGTMHALEACRRGWEVVHLEADAGPRRASVRNFGLVWVSGRAPGPELALAVRARELWEQIAAHSPAVGFRPDGSLTVARHEAGAGPHGRGRRPARRRAPGLRAARSRRRPGRQPGRPGRPGRRPALPSRRRRRARPGPGCPPGDPRGHRPLHVAPPPPGGRRRHTAGGTAVAVDHLGQRHEGSAVVLCIGDRLSGLGGRVGRHPGRRPPAAVPAPDDADGPGRPSG